MNGKQRGQRDLPVEALRIIACLMVIATHVKPGMTLDGVPDFSRVLLTVLVGDGVCVFWCILGFFLLRDVPGGSRTKSAKAGGSRTEGALVGGSRAENTLTGGDRADDAQAGSSRAENTLTGGDRADSQTGSSRTEDAQTAADGMRAQYGALLRRTFRRVFLPMTVFTLVMFYFSGFLLEGQSLAQSLRHSPEAYSRFFFGSVLGADPVVGCTAHLWYLFVYIFVILLYPCFWGLQTCFGATEQQRRRRTIAFFGILLVNDLTWNGLLGISHHGFGGVAGAAPMIFLGDYLYRNRDKVHGNRKTGAAGIAAFLLVDLLWAVTELAVFRVTPDYESRQNRINVFSYVKMISLYLAVMGLPGFFPGGVPAWIKKTVRHLGTASFWIYLVHFPLLTFSVNVGVTGFWNRFKNGSGSGDLVYTLGMTLSIFLMSLAIAELILLGKRLLSGRGKGRRRRLVIPAVLAAVALTAAFVYANDEAGRIFNTQQNELGELTGGEPGDQTGKEARIEAYPVYYRPDSYPWDYLLHCTRDDVRACVSALAVDAAENDMIGYDCGEYACTLWEQAQSAGYDIAAISTPCCAQCATAVLTFYKCAGYLLEIEELKEIDVDKSVWDMDDVLEPTGLFEKISDSSRLHSPDGNAAGDIYVAESRHTILQVTDGAGREKAE